MLDAQTGTTAFTLPGGGNRTSSFAWSSDSQYLSAFTLNATTSTNQVWNISTHQLVATYPGESHGGAVWQPGTHTLALVKVLLKASGDPGTAVVIWNPLTRKELKQIPIADLNFASGSLAWSPNGQRLVYGILFAGKDVAVIVNSTTGQQLYAYPAGDHHSGELVAWSPDGKYIISGTSDISSSAEANPGAQVWIA